MLFNFSAKPFVVSTGRGRLIETVLLSAQNKCCNLMNKKIITNLGSYNFLIWIYVRGQCVLGSACNEKKAPELSPHCPPPPPLLSVYANATGEFETCSLFI